MKTATDKLQDFIKSYQELSEKEKFGCAKIFHDSTGGKLSPFNSPSPVCVGLVPVRSPAGEVGFLGVRRAIHPFVGEVALVGGFLSPGENPSDGTVREILEETGISVDPNTLSAAGIPVIAHNNNLLIFLKSSDIITANDFNAAAANIKNADGEVQELVFITPQTTLCFPLHQEAVNAAFLDLGQTPRVEPSKAFRV